jgi:hypothetical protein
MNIKNLKAATHVTLVLNGRVMIHLQYKYTTLVMVIFLEKVNIWVIMNKFNVVRICMSVNYEQKKIDWCIFLDIFICLLI